MVTLVGSSDVRRKLANGTRREASDRRTWSTYARLLAAVVACGIAATANAEIVHFVNPAPGEPGHYDWHFPSLGWGANYLDITRAPWEQTNTPNGNSVVQRRIGPEFTDRFDDGSAINGHQAWEWAGEAPLANVLAVEAGWMFPSSIYTAALQFDDLIGPDPDGSELFWSDRARHVFWAFGLDTEFPLNEHRYIGVEIEGGRYGWIEVARTSPLTLTAYAWAYETTPGVPIRAGQVPAPGAGVALALAALFAARRRRRPSGR